jgi:ferric-dicitrate binding protein FerR (iron transport regulator)
MSTARIDELAAAWSVQDPDPALHAELEALLLRDPAARRRFLDHCVGEMAISETLGRAAPAIPRRARTRLRRAGGRRPTAAIVAWAAGIAALLLVGILLIPGGPTLRVTAGSVVADGRIVPVGGRVTLPLSTALAGEQGAALDDAAGVAVTIAPRGAFSIRAPGVIDLESGALTVEVDGRRAPPTSVRTRELVAHVVGTQFSVTRHAGTSAVAVQHGTVRVVTPDLSERAVTAGMRIVATTTGFLADTPTTPQPPPPALPPIRLLLINEDGSVGREVALDQPLRLPAERLFSLRAEVGDEVGSLTFLLGDTSNLPKRPRSIEQGRPFDLWADVDQQPILSTLPVGTHHLTIICYSDHRGEQVRFKHQLTLIAE